MFIFSKVKRVLFFSMFFFNTTFAQDKTIDSLKKIIRNPKLHDTTKLAAIGSVMDNNYTENDPNYYYLNNLIGQLAEKKIKEDNEPTVAETYKMWLGTYYTVLAIDYSHKKKAAKSIEAIDKSIAYYKSANSLDDAYYQVIVKATIYSLFNENEKAINNLFIALRHFEKNKKENSDEIAYAMSTLATIYFSIGNYKKSIEYNKKAINYHNLNVGHVDYQKNHLKSVAYANIADNYLSLKNYSEAVANGQKALLYSEKTGDSITMSFILSKIGIAKMNLLKYDEAERLFKKALDITSNERSNSQTYNALGKLYFDKKQFDKSEFYAYKGLELGKKINDVRLQMDSYQILFLVYKKTKNHEKALETYIERNRINTKISSVASKKLLEEQQLKYDFEKKELNYKLATEKKTATKNNWLIALSSSLLLVLLGVYFYYRNNRQKQAITVLEKNQIKQKLLISQMNPHFIFNSVQNIRSLISNKQNDEAVDYLGKFSKLTRQILENSNENYISLEEEVEMIENYLSIQQLLYENKFTFTIDVEDAIDKESIFLPPMLAQPFIENAIKHGLSNTLENGKITVHFYLKDEKLFFEVTDNGKGFDTDKKVSNHKSLAMSITKERLVNYTKNKDFIVLTENIINSAGKVEGAKVVFEIPYIYEN